MGTKLVDGFDVIDEENCFYILKFDQPQDRIIPRPLDDFWSLFGRHKMKPRVCIS